MSQLSRCRPRLLKLLTPSFPLLSSKRHHNPIGWIPLYTARRRLQSSSTRIQIRTVPSRETQRAIDRVELVLHKLEASSCVSSSKIQLALRGLQQQEAPVRIGVLGPHCEELLKAFLQPDKEDTAQWAKDLSRWIDRHRENPTAGVLLRYGQYVKRLLGDVESSSSGVAILSAPIEVLRTHALEVLIVPGATTPTTSPVFFLPNGRMIDVPVHKAVEYLGTGAAGLGRLLSSAVSVAHEKRNGTTIKSIVGLEKMEPVDITATVRSVRSLSNPDMDGARTWLLAGTTTTGEPIKPAVAAFIRDVLREAVEELSVVKPSVAASDIPVEELGAAITTWTASAHSSLKLDLEDAGFGSKFWHKIDWWKLLWRVDDVGHVARYVISEHFLRKDEGDAVFLSGRIFQAGAEGETVADFTPRDIAHERDDIIRELIPGLQIAAQRALGRMLEIAAASSGGGALLAVGGADLLIAGAAAGVGVLGGLAHLRKRWDHEKREFEQAVQERGRVVVLETERWAWDRLRAVELAARPKLERSEEEELRRQVEEALVVLDALDHRPADV